ncbi:MAG: hypothetical protein Q8P46_15885 [Hyphomicrobiales bacterium]|nr:hypothetical protein [Hyphomicrobiales bacterium]
MKTVLVVVLFAVVGTLGDWIISFLANLAGGVGAIIGFMGRPKEVSGFRKVLPVVTCTLAQTYVFLAWVAFVVSYTTLVTTHQPVVRWLVWIVAFYAAMVPSIAASGDSVRAEKENPELKYSVPHLALSFSGLLDIAGFFLFAFLPKTMLYAWAWVPFVRDVTRDAA